MRTDHHLHIGDMSELYTAVLVLQQVENGAISLSDTIDRWLDLPYVEDVSVRMLLSHRSGISNYLADPRTGLQLLLLPAKSWQIPELLDRLAARDPRFEPGTQYERSISNPLLLGLILQEATGKSYADLLQEEILIPLGLRDTFYLDYPPDLPIAAAYHESFMGLAYPNVTSFRRALETSAAFGGGMLSTSHDVAVFLHALFTGSLVSEDTLSQMLQSQDESSGCPPQGLGCGFGIQFLRIAEEEYVGHRGAMLGYSSVAVHNPEYAATIALLGNLSMANQSQLPQPLLPHLEQLISDQRSSS